MRLRKREQRKKIVGFVDETGRVHIHKRRTTSPRGIELTRKGKAAIRK